VNRRTKSSLLWGIVGGMTFVVLAQGYLILFGSLPIGWVGLAAIGLLIAAVVATVSYTVEPRLAAVGR